MKFIKACEIDRDIRLQISTVFVDGFHQWLKFFSKDKEKLARAFAHMFNLDVFYVAMEGDAIAGITACTDGVTRCVHLEKPPLRQHLGLIMGALTHSILKNQFEEKPYPFAIPAGMGTIEFVATAPQHRGKGVAKELIGHITTAEPFAEYVLEVADTNTSAVRLYEKLGFAEFMRVKEKHSKQSGVNYLVYMKLDKGRRP